MGLKKRSVSISLLIFFAVAALVLAFVFQPSAAYAAEDRHDVTSTRRSISAGITETEYFTQNSTNDDQVVTYAIEVDMSRNTLIAGYHDYDTSGAWAMSTVRDQAAAAESKRKVNVVAAVNADFFNMSTGEPTGVLVMNGEQVKVTESALARNWFAITADNKAHIGSGALPENTVEAIGGDLMLIENGEIIQNSSDTYYTTKQPRTAVGITAEGSVVLVVADGRQSPYSSGYTYHELAQKMYELGCVVAMNLDGGGSTTYLAQYAGTDELVLANSPSDTNERSVSSSLLVVSNAEKTGVFGSAAIEPNNEVYTPGSAVDLSAIGADTAGFPVAIPAEAQWRVAEKYADMGTIEGSVEEDGTATAVFTAAENKTGTAVIELVYNGQVYGSTSLELQWPDKLTMSNSVYSLDFSERTDFGLTAYWETRIVHLKTGDLKWEIGPTGNEEYPSIGKMDGDIFVADAEATNVTATVTARLAYDENVSVSAEVSVGQLPTVAWDFEDIKDPETGEVITKAEDYYTVAEDTSAYFRISYDPNNSGAKGSAQIVDATTGEVRVGEKALQLNYDFTNNAVAQVTAGVYFGPSTRYEVPGHPTGLGVWVYAPEGTPNFWLRSYLFGEDENGNPTAGNVGWGGDKGAYVVDFTSSTSPLHPGWYYYEADLTNFTNLPYTWILTNQTFRIMQLTGNGEPVAGYLYLDNFQFVYGANTDDLFAPEIQSVQLSNASGADLEDGMTVSDDPFAIYASYNEFMGLSDEELDKIENESEREAYEKAPMYATGVNTSDVHVYVDGNEIELALVTETELFTKDIHLPNGKHEITIEVNDNFQNQRSVSYIINVKNDSNYASAGLEGAGEEPYLGSDYLLNLVADLPASVQSATFEVRLTRGFSIEVGEEVAGFTVTECGLTHVNNNVYTVTVERTEGEVAEGNTVIAQFKIYCAPTLPEGSVLTYSIEVSSVEYASGVQDDVLNSFYAEAEVEVLPYYIIEADTMVIGSTGGYIYVTDANGNPAAGVTVTIDGEPLEGTTDEEGKIFTDIFVSEKCSKTVAAYSELGYSYSVTVYGVLPGGLTDAEGKPVATPAYVRSVATVDGNTEQRIFWLANPLAASASAQVRFATEADYLANGDKAFQVVNGTNQLLEFTGTYAVYVNHVLLENLAENTRYVYQAGDGTTWSELKYFSTTKHSGSTDFIVMGDTQAENKSIFEAYGNAIVNSGINYDFAIQTGDFVDQGNDYELWTAILEIFSEYFSDIDFVHTFGNHEYSGDAIYPMAMTFSPSEKYYSVTYGNVYVAVINCYTESDMQEAAAWIKEDAAKSDAVWKVLSLHRPPYYTNVIGGSENSNKIIPALADEAGFDVVFSGHDHSFARTEPMTGGAVDEENGTVYYIVGAAEEGGKYEITDNPDFHFAKVSGDFNALYFSVHATDTEMVITVYNLTDDGTTFEVFDSYTIRNGCASLNHEFSYIDGQLVCSRCHYTVLPSEIGFSGLVQDENGKNWYFNQGSLWKGWLQYGEDQYYFLEDGSAADGEYAVDDGYGDFTYIFENGKKVGGETRWYGEKYYVDGSFVTGWINIDGDYYYLWTSGHFDADYYPNYEVGDRVKGGLQRVTVNMVGYEMPVHLYFDDNGKLLGPVNDENGEMLPGVFFDRGERYSYLIITTQSDGTIVGDYYLNGLLTANDLVPAAEGNVYGIRWETLQVGDMMQVGDDYYRFSDVEGTPLEDGRGAMIGRYYKVRINQYTGTYETIIVYQNEKIPAEYLEPDPVEGNSIKYYEFLGWYSDNTLIDLENWVATSNITVSARFARRYQQIYGDVVWANNTLIEAAASGTPYDKRRAVGNMDYVLSFMNEEQIADCIAENSTIFDLYNEMKEKVYTVTFVVDGETVLTSQLYEGEAITAPDTTPPAGNSIKSYVTRWYNGDEVLANGAVASGSVTYTLSFDLEYTQKYLDIQSALEALEKEGMTPAEKHAALDAATDVYETLSEEEKTDARAEAVDFFELYDEMLGKLYEVTFGDGEAIVVYEGETVAAPVDPTKESDSSVVESYTFDGWFDGDTKYSADMQIEMDMTFEAKFEAVYTDKYNAMKSALDALIAVQDKTPAEKHAALDVAINAYEAMSETEIADAKAEGLSFETYEDMLGKLYEVTFGDGEAIVVYEGETVEAPVDPTKESNSSVVESYTFAGWFDGDTKYSADMQIEMDMAFEATFTAVYTEEYLDMQAALSSLEQVENGSLEEQYKALSAVYALMQNFSEEEKTDAKAEGMSFDLYEKMLAEYNGTANGAEEDLNAAIEASDALLAVAAAAATMLTLAALAFVVKEMII